MIGRITLGIVGSAVALSLAAAGCEHRRTRGPEVTTVAAYDGPPADRATVVAEIEKRKADADSRIDEFDEMILATDIDGKQLGAFLAAVERRHKKWEEYRGSAKHAKLQALQEQARAAKQADDKKKMAALETQIKPLAEAEREYRMAIRAEVVSVMDLEQQRDWANHVLWSWGRLGGRLRRAKLTEDQMARAKTLTRAEMNNVIRPGTMQKDPYLWIVRGGNEDAKALKDKIADKVAKTVLTAEQREAIAPK